MKQILSVVNYIHKNGIIHRDLRLENILLDNSVSGNLSIQVKFIIKIYLKKNL